MTLHGDMPVWSLRGYASAAAYEAAIAHDLYVAQLERERAERLRAARSDPNSPLNRPAPMRGQPTLDDVASEDEL